MMTQHSIAIDRRQFVGRVGAGAAALTFGQLAALEALAAEMAKMGSRAIPSTGERLPMVGVGTSRVFNVTLNAETRARLGGVLKAMLEAGGTVIDTANGYGGAEGVAGRLVSELGVRDKVFIATKIGAYDRADGLAQIRNSLKLFNTRKIELMQIHNLRDWRTQIKTLRAMKEQGVFKYIGVTHYATEPEDEIARIIANEKIDFFQLPYSIARRDGERRIMPLARDKGVAILTHRNFGRGALFRQVRGKALPPWAAAEYDITSWAQYFLKFVLAHPASTAVIPGTGKIRHMRDNVRAGMGRMPDAAGRTRMVKYMASL
jgi:aryl-alcohol dehydrogenase-like predicted oxidoreductase